MNYKRPEIIVSGGDIPAGTWDFYEGKLRLYDQNKEVDLSSHLVKMEIVNYKNDRTIGGTGSAAIVGAVIAGPLGAIAGGLYGGKRDTESVIYCELSDGKKFVAKVDNELLSGFRLLVTSKPKSDSSVISISREEQKRKEYQNTQESKDGCLMYAFAAVVAVLIMIFYD